PCAKCESQSPPESASFVTLSYQLCPRMPWSRLDSPSIQMKSAAFDGTLPARRTTTMENVAEVAERCRRSQTVRGSDMKRSLPLSCESRSKAPRTRPRCSRAEPGRLVERGPVLRFEIHQNTRVVLPTPPSE